MTLADSLQRPLRDLRISVTDRCNFRCTYCMPREVFGADFPFLPKKELLTFEEIARLASIFAALGVRKLRLTGGEPLLRRDLHQLIAMLTAIDEIEDIALTTNGSLLAAQARTLREAGLRRLTVSLDSLDDAIFSLMNDANFPVARVLTGIEAAIAAGFSPIKINMVVKRGLNDESILPMARRFRGSQTILRLIEYMDVGNSNGWQRAQVVPGAEMLARIAREFPLELMPARSFGEVANRYRYRDGGGEIAVITSVTQPFCSDCTRARLTADGRLYTCLFATAGSDLRAALRGGDSDERMAAHLGAIWRNRGDRYSELRAANRAMEPKVEMSRLGG